MNKFLYELKNFCLSKFEDSSVDIHGYYETVVQNIEYLQDIVGDCEKYKFQLRYEHDDTDGYSEGTINVYLETGHYYKILLGYDERHWGYCECTTEDKGYDTIHNCCGEGCDWSAPSVTISKIQTMGHFNFDGYEKDLWQFKKEWISAESNLDVKQRELEKQSQIDWFDQQIEELKKRKELVVNGDCVEFE